MDISTVETALGRLQTIAVENPGLQGAMRFYQRLIPILNELGKDIPGITIDPKVIHQKCSAGIPILAGEALEVDAVQTRRIFQAIATAAKGADEAEDSLTAQKAGAIQDAVETDALDPHPLMLAVDNGEAGPVEDAASRLGLDPQLLVMMAQNTLKVFLRAWREKLGTPLDLDDWRQSACPFCGMDAALSEIRGVESARYLRCLRCGAGWPYPHLRCAFCENEDHKTLGVLMVEGLSRKYYVHTCERCKRYLKTVITFEAIPIDLLIVEDLATLQLDWLAGQRGYR